MRLDIVLVDQRSPLVAAWERAFEGVDGVRALEDDLFAQPADAMVSPANSFGIMDGGVDRAIRDRLGFPVERAVQQRILERHHGELHVGEAEIIATGSDEWPYLVVAPTMRVPESVAQTLNAYCAFRAVLLGVTAFNAATPATPIAPSCAQASAPGSAAWTRSDAPFRCEWRSTRSRARRASRASPRSTRSTER